MKVGKKGQNNGENTQKTTQNAHNRNQILNEQEYAEALRGWSKLKGIEIGAEAQEIKRLGLHSAVVTGRLAAYRWTGETGDENTVVAAPADLRPTTILYEVRGPRNKLYGLNLNSPERVLVGSSTACCSPDIAGSTKELWVSGPILGYALMGAVEPQMAVQGIPDTGNPHVAHLGGEGSHHIYIAARNRELRRTWHRLARKYSCEVTLVDFNEIYSLQLDDTDDTATIANRVLGVLQASERKPVIEVWVDEQQGYAIEKNRTIGLSLRKQGEGEWVEKEILAEFTARITQQRLITSGEDSDQDEQEFVIEGTGANGRKFPAISVNIAQFNDMSWALKLWGAQAVIHAKYGTRARMATAILMMSNAHGFKSTTVYRHLGFILHPEHGWIFLSPGAVIGAKGELPNIEVSPQGRLADYQIPPPPERVPDFALATLDLLKLAPPLVAFPTLAAMFRAPLGQIDTVLILVGETGRHKTAYLALVFGHYGPKFHRKHLPQGWGSSGLGLEVVAYHAKDVVLVIDDLKFPKDHVGKAALLSAARRIISSAADGVGRTTLTQDRRLRFNSYPRGLIMMSAEEVPDGESTVARTLIIPVSEPLQGPDNHLRPAYEAAEVLASQGVYAKTMSAFLQYVAQRHDDVSVGSERHRQHISEHEALFTGRHQRTGPACAELSYGWRVFLDFCTERSVISAEKAESLWQECVEALQEVSVHQGEFVEAENPVHVFEDMVGTLFSQQRIHLVDLQTDGVPQHEPELLGWHHNGTEYVKGQGSVKVGWTGKKDGRVWGYFMSSALYESLKVTGFRAQQTLPSKTALLRALRDEYEKRGLMLCETETNGITGVKKQRYTYSVTISCEKSQKKLLTLSLPLGVASNRSGGSGIKKVNQTTETEDEDIPLPFPQQFDSGIDGINDVSSPTEKENHSQEDNLNVGQKSAIFVEKIKENANSFESPPLAKQKNTLPDDDEDDFPY